MFRLICKFGVQFQLNFVQINTLIMAYTTRNLLKQLSEQLNTKPKATHITLGLVTILGMRNESDLTESLEIYVKDEGNKRYWVSPKTLNFYQD